MSLVCDSCHAPYIYILFPTPDGYTRWCGHCGHTQGEPADVWIPPEEK